MADEDRAAKAARAKAMLKKRQQQKKAGPAPTESNAPSPPPSRPYTPASAPKSPEESAPPARDVSDLFGAADPQDTSWISGLQPAAPSPVAPPPAPPQLASPPLRASAGGPPLHATRPSISQASGRSSDGAMHALQAERESMVAQMNEVENKLQETQKLLQDEVHRSAVLQETLTKLQAEKESIGQNHQQTVSFLVSEKASLSEELQRLAGLEVEATNLRQQLEGEKDETISLRQRLHAAQDDLETASKDNERLNETEKNLTEKTREQERMLQVTNVTVVNLQKEVEIAQRRYRELEEQIQSDDRLEKLEDTLRNTQDRTADLELQLSRQKQAYSALKEERERLETELAQHRDAEEGWKSRYASLEEEHTSTKASLETAESDQAELRQDKEALQAEVHSLQSDITILQEKLTQAALELAAHTRQLQGVQSELKSAKRRAEEAERIQSDLQAEGTGLMRSLEEMRPKIVELTGIKLELSEKVAGLESEVKSREAVIARLEAELDADRAAKEDAEKQLIESRDAYEKERQAERGSMANLTNEQAELTEELESAYGTIRSLEAERAAARAEAVKYMDELERISHSMATQTDTIRMMRDEADERDNMRKEEEEYLNQAQSEIEGLRQAIESRDDEIERLRMTSSDGTPPSFDAEMLGDIKQQHALELSSMQSRIRSLESAVFEAEARAHELQKQLTDSRQSLLSPPLGSAPSRPTSRTGTVVSPPPMSRTLAIDQSLSPEARHKRKVSLSMLKARIERESGQKLEPVPDEHNPGHPLMHSHHARRPQFLDDSHVFWCSSCKGDLVIL